MLLRFFFDTVDVADVADENVHTVDVERDVIDDDIVVLHRSAVVAFETVAFEAVAFEAVAFETAAFDISPILLLSVVDSSA